MNQLTHMYISLKQKKREKEIILKIKEEKEQSKGIMLE